MHLIPTFLQYVESPQDLLNQLPLFMKRRGKHLTDGDAEAQDHPFCSTSYACLQIFGVSLWSYSYGECRKIWEKRENKREGEPSYFPFILDIKDNRGYIFLGLRLGLKYFLFSGEREVFKKLQCIVRKEEGEIFLKTRL